MVSQSKRLLIKQLELLLSRLMDSPLGLEIIRQNLDTGNCVYCKRHGTAVCTWRLSVVYKDSKICESCFKKLQQHYILQEFQDQSFSVSANIICSECGYYSKSGYQYDNIICCLRCASQKSNELSKLKKTMFNLHKESWSLFKKTVSKIKFELVVMANQCLVSDKKKLQLELQKSQRELEQLQTQVKELEKERDNCKIKYNSSEYLFQINLVSSVSKQLNKL